MPDDPSSRNPTPPAARRIEVGVEALEAAAYTVPTEEPESDGTYRWDSTTLVVAHASGGSHAGFGYTYADTATAVLIRDKLRPVVLGRDAMDVPGCWSAMAHAVRNLGRPGISSMAIAAVDSALWDLKAKLLDVSMVTLLGRCRVEVPVYGSGGFTSYSLQQLQAQMEGWAAEGMRAVKMKIGSDPEADPARVRAVREVVGSDVDLYVDANGAYDRKQALGLAERFRDQGVVWFEEPVPSDDLEGLHLVRERAPAGMRIAAGEYGYDLLYFRRMLEAEAVDVLQADATRCAGISGFLGVSPLIEARCMALSAHCAPSLHVAPCCALRNLWPIEFFHDHVRIESMLFDGVLSPVEGCLRPDLSRPGLGLELKRRDAERFAVR